MNDQLKKTIEEEIIKTPKEIQDVVNSVDWITISEKIGKEHSLTENEIINIQTEIAFILIGAEHINDLAVNIEHKTNISKDESEKIALEILQKICLPIADKITENAKESLKNKKPTWDQNINFILSGGDYTEFLRKINTNTNFQDKPNPEKTPINYSKIEDLKNKFTI